MRITHYTDYSLRVLIYVALTGEHRTTIRDIADRYGISRNHLMKVVQELSNNGYLLAQRGNNGGICLKRNPEDINVGTLVRQTEQDFELAECFGSQNACIITPACTLKNLLAEALQAFFRVLDQYTLADLLPEANQVELVRLLGMADAVGAEAHQAVSSTGPRVLHARDLLAIHRAR